MYVANVESVYSIMTLYCITFIGYYHIISVEKEYISNICDSILQYWSVF
jgi:hypothetical protein